MRPRHTLLALALALTLAASFWPLQEEDNAEDLLAIRPHRPTHRPAKPSVDSATPHAADTVPTRVLPNEPPPLHANLFPAQTWHPPAPPQPALQEEKTLPEPDPMPEPPYTYLGRWQEHGREITYLSRQERLLAITPGMLLDHVWQVQHIERERITLLYLPRQQTVELKLTP